MELIGNTLDLIANEKSGIIKKSVPCIIGPTCLERKPIFDRAE
jgi:folylpolyglutamate synthase/dihydropteroate synthase